LKVGETKTSTVSVGNGYVYYQSGGSKGSYSFSGSTLSYTGSSVGNDNVTVYATNACYTATANLSVTVLAAPAPVTAGDQSITVRSGETYSGALPIGGAWSNLTLAQAPAHGSSGLLISGGVLQYTASAPYSGTDTLKYTASGDGGSATGTVNITVLPPLPPTMSGRALSTPYNTAATAILTASGAVKGFRVVSNGAHGSATVSLNEDNEGDFQYTPQPGFIGTDTVSLVAEGYSADSQPVDVTITVNAPAAPTVSNSTLAVAYNTPATGSVTATGGGVSYALGVGAAHGTAAVAGDGSFTYTPAPGFIGADLFTVKATNPGGEAFASISVNVAAPAAPVAQGGSINTGYKQSVTFALPATGIVSSYSLSGPAVGGTASLSGGSATFVPADGFIGVGGIDYTVDGPGGSGSGHFSINVAAPGAPVLQGASLSTEEGEPVGFNIVTSGVVTAVESYSSPAHGSVVLSGSNATYTPAPGYIGPDSFQLVAKGVGVDSAPATFNVSVVAPPPPPPSGPEPVTCADGSVVIPPQSCPVVHPDPGLLARPGEGATQVNTPIAVNLMRLVQGAPVETLDVVEQAKNGVVEVESGEALYTPQEDFVGTDQFVYRATARNGQSAQAIVTVTVEGAVPVVTDVRIEVVGGVPYTVDLAQAAEGGPFESAELVDAPDKGSATFSGTVMTYTAPADFSGEARMRFAVRNRFGGSDPANLIATVLAAAVPATELKATVLQGKEVRVDLTQGARGGPFTAANLVAFDGQTGNARIEEADGKFYLVYSSKGAFAGLTRVGFTLSNVRTVSATAFVSIDVTERENPALNKDVSGLVNSQTATANRMGEAQLSNVMGRLERMHNGRRETGLSVAFPMTREFVARDEEAKRDFAAELDEAFGRGETPMSTKGVLARGEAAPVSVWAGGAIDLGHARGAERRSKTKFTTSGLSAGIDAPIGDTVVLGAGFGFGKDSSKIGDSGTKSDAASVSFFGYGSYQPGRATFLDAVLGVSKIDFDSERYIEASGSTVSGSRRGDQVFGAISAGWEHQGPRLMISPYGRIQFVVTDLKGFVEQGDDTYALAFLSQKASEVTGAVGVRGQLRYDLEDGALLPAFRLEYRQKLHSGGAARMRYADWADSPVWSLQTDRSDDQSLLVGAGSTYQRGEWTIGAEVEHMAGDNGSRSTRLRVNGSTKF
jgi:uncharacterized protein YhjY with autotransporter beta-barrel domain